MDITELRTKMTPSRTEQETERPTGGTSRGSWRRRSLIATVALALGLYLRRRRRSGGAEPTVSDGGTETTQTVDHETPESESEGRSLGRRLVMMAISTIAITLARRAFRRLRKGR